MSDATPPLHAAKWFEIPAPDLDASQRFCETVLDRPLRREVMGANTIAMPRTSLPPGMGIIAHLIDVAGNRIGLHALD